MRTIHAFKANLDYLARSCLKEKKWGRRKRKKKIKKEIRRRRQSPHTCNPRTQEAEVEGSNELQDSLRCRVKSNINKK